MTDRRRRRAANAEPSHEDNPFAPPAEGTPDRPWQPRRPADSDDPGDADQGGGGSRDGRDGRDGRGRGDNGQDGDKPSRWGRQWSNRQPGRQGGGFGMPGSSGSGNGNGGNGRDPGGRRSMRWDPTDPLQRRARYALHAGIWGLFFALFSLTEVALLLGTLSVYWGISALRGDTNGKPGAAGAGTSSGSGASASAEDISGSDRSARPDAGGTGPSKPGTPPVHVSVTPEQAAKARSTAAISGLIAGGLSIVIVAATFTVQMIYSDYYTCEQDALTTSSQEQCKDLLPEEVRPFLTERE